MFNLEEILDRVKEILDQEHEGKVFLKHVAAAIGMDRSLLYTHKSRNSIPYDYLMEFCIKNNISASWLFYGLGYKHINFKRKCILIEITEKDKKNATV